MPTFLRLEAFRLAKQWRILKNKASLHLHSGFANMCLCVLIDSVHFNFVRCKRISVSTVTATVSISWCVAGTCGVQIETNFFFFF